MNSAHICVFLRNYEVPVTDIAIAVEERGFDGMFVPENTHMPITRRQTMPVDEERIRQLGGLHDPFVTLGAAAAVTKRIKLGMSVCLLTHRDPIVTAKAVASLDHLSNGRLILGVAGGFVAEAMENHGSPFKQRWNIVRERCHAMREIWQNDKAAFDGESVSFGPSESYPKPIHPNGPPILIGSNSAAVPDRVADYADGWIVFNGRYQGDAVADLRRACEEAERDVDTVHQYLMDPPDNLDGLRRSVEQGFNDFIFIVRVEDIDGFQTSLDHLAKLCSSLHCVR